MALQPGLQGEHGDGGLHDGQMMGHKGHQLVRKLLEPGNLAEPLRAACSRS